MSDRDENRGARCSTDVEPRVGPDEAGGLHMGKTRDVVERFYERFGATT
jgi:hypothetical protein